MKPTRAFGVVPYYVICFAALAAIYLIELYRGAHLVNYLIPLIGFLGVFSRWSVGPLILLLVVGGSQVARKSTGLPMDLSGTAGLRGADALLCVAFLAYTAAHYRVLGLVFSVLPPDPRRLAATDARDRRPQIRSPHLADPVEVGTFLLALPVWVILGHVIWTLLSLPWNVPGVPARITRVILLAWAIGIALFVASAFFGLWKRRQHSAGEAALFLQDTLWRETRGDQRRIHRWLAWARLKRRGENA